MAFFDAISSVAFSFSTIPIPKGSPDVYSPLGTQGTCTAQAFFIQAGIASPLFNFSLSLYYLFLVKYAIPESRIRQRIEPWMQRITVSFAFGTCFVCLGLGMFNDSSLWCWINALPKGCSQSYNSQDGTCTRGDNAEIFRWLFFFAPLWAAILGTMVSMYMLWAAVRAQEDKASKWEMTYTTASQFGGGVPHNEEAKQSWLQSAMKSARELFRKWKTPSSNDASKSHVNAAESSTAAQQLNTRQIELQRAKSKKQHFKSNLVMWHAMK